jgi:hypothetical protein
MCVQLKTTMPVHCLKKISRIPDSATPPLVAGFEFQVSSFEFLFSDGVQYPGHRGSVDVATADDHPDISPNR